VAVCIHGEADLTMAERFHDDTWMHTLGQQ
jgi:hypothetical protein